MSLPDFLILGAAKAGTTSLAAYLAQHPGAFIPPRIKEPNHFAFPDVTPSPVGPAPPDVLHRLIYNWSHVDRAAYEALFDAARPGQIRGEASVRYLYFEGTAGRIQAALPEVRLIAVLREPTARLISHYNMNRQFQIEPLTLAAALEAEPARIAAGWGWDWHYRAVGRYADQLALYFERFCPEQVKVVLYDDFVADPHGVFAAICRHIGLDDGFVPDMSARGMVPYRPRLKALDRWLTWPNPFLDWMKRRPRDRLTYPVTTRLQRWNREPVAPVDPVQRRTIAESFRADNRRLSNLLGRSLPWPV